MTVVLEEDGSPDISEVLLYVEGQLETIAAVADDPINTASTQDVSIGVYTTNNIRFFQGLIDEVRIYDEALSQEEIQAIMNE